MRVRRQYPPFSKLYIRARDKDLTAPGKFRFHHTRYGRALQKQSIRTRLDLATRIIKDEPVFF